MTFLGPGSADKVYKYLEPHLPDDQLRLALTDEASVAVLTFTDAAKIFGGFQDATQGTAVAKRLARLSNVWCCGSGSLRLMSYGLDVGLNSFTAA